MEPVLICRSGRRRRGRRIVVLSSVSPDRCDMTNPCTPAFGGFRGDKRLGQRAIWLNLHRYRVALAARRCLSRTRATVSADTSSPALAGSARTRVFVTSFRVDVVLRHRVLMETIGNGLYQLVRYETLLLDRQLAALAGVVVDRRRTRTPTPRGRGQVRGRLFADEACSRLSMDSTRIPSAFVGGAQVRRATRPRHRLSRYGRVLRPPCAACGKTSIPIRCASAEGGARRSGNNDSWKVDRCCRRGRRRDDVNTAATQRPGREAAHVALQRWPVLAAAARTVASETPRIAFAPSRPCSSSRPGRSAPLFDRGRVERRAGRQRSAISRFDRGPPPCRRPGRETGRRITVAKLRPPTFRCPWKPRRAPRAAE